VAFRFCSPQETGFSTGLEYDSGINADPSEIITLAQVVADIAELRGIDAVAACEKTISGNC